MLALRRFFQDYPGLNASVLTVLFVLPAVLAWLNQYGERLTQLTLYEWFPLFGMLAFTLMLSHVAVGAFVMIAKLDMQLFKPYYRFTAYAVLLCMLLHPGLLIWQLYQDGYGLPPNSYLNFVDMSLRLFILFGSISFVIFLLFETKRKFGNRPWWYMIERASDVALILIFVHGLRLGTHVQAGWFRVVWIVYGIILMSCLIYAFDRRHRLGQRRQGV